MSTITGTGGLGRTAGYRASCVPSSSLYLNEAAMTYWGPTPVCVPAVDTPYPKLQIREIPLARGFSSVSSPIDLIM
ncbi:hypothetical protein KL936_003413 [Ogataea polymorpha]|nr:hypothetical protein KL936_003413 [Ogataea polymorpha]